MGSINRVVLMGLIGNHPELKTSSGGKPYVHLSLSTYRRIKNSNGSAQRETQWHKIMIWGKNAELCSSFCTKGSPLYIEGHLANYTKEDNGNRTFHVGIVAEQIQLIPGLRHQALGDFGEEELSETTAESKGGPGSDVQSARGLLN
jgi:single-strand DNA-binding protein